MTIQNHLQNNDIKPESAKNNNLSQIGKILATGIYRLCNKNLQKKELKRLDSNSDASVHEAINNLNL